MSDREKLIDWISDIIDFVDWEHIEEVADHLIENGVVIQKQGEWLFHKNPRNDDYWECTTCNGTWWLESGETPQENEMYYCPMCGAKMKEVR